MTDEERARERWAEVAHFPYPEKATPIEAYDMMLDYALVEEDMAKDIQYALENQVRDLKNALIEATWTIKKVKGF